MVVTFQRIIELSPINGPEFPIDSLPENIREFVIQLSRELQTPYALAANMVLSCISGSISKKAIVAPYGNWIEQLNLYFVTAIEPANRKSAIVSACAKPILRFQENLINETKSIIIQDRANYQSIKQAIEQAQTNKAKKLATGKSTEEETNIIKKLAKELSELTNPDFPQLVVDDFTVEALADLIKANGEKIMILSAEGDLFDIAAGRYGTGGANFSILLKGHSNDMVTVNRTGRESKGTIHEPAITIGITTQPEVIKNLTSKAFRGRGLLGRFLYSLPHTNIGMREINPPSMSDKAREEYEDLVKKLLTKPLPEKPEHLCFSDEALKVFKLFCIGIEKRMGKNGDISIMQDWAGKLCGAVARLSGILHVCKNPLECSKVQISYETVTASILLGQYYIEHAKIVFEAIGTDKEIEDAREFLDWIKRRQVKEFTRRQIFESLKSRYKKSEMLSGGLKVLEERNYIMKEKIGKTEKFTVNPAIFSRNC